MAGHRGDRRGSGRHGAECAAPRIGGAAARLVALRPFKKVAFVRKTIRSVRAADCLFWDLSILPAPARRPEASRIPSNHSESLVTTSSWVFLMLAAAGSINAYGADTVPYPAKAPIEQYRIADRNDEIALARSAAPPSISADAEVLVLGSRGFETAVKGKNGFVCVVERAWAAGFDDAEFRNPHVRSPNCFNAPAAHAVLPQFLKRTEWVLAG